MWNALFGGGGAAPGAAASGETPKAAAPPARTSSSSGAAQDGIVAELSAAQRLLRKLSQISPGNPEAWPALNECSRLSERLALSGCVWRLRAWRLGGAT